MLLAEIKNKQKRKMDFMDDTIYKGGVKKNKRRVHV